MSDDSSFDLEMTRLFDARPEEVYRAFVDPDHLTQWYGPPGFPVPRETVDIDSRVGGHIRFAMVSVSDPTVRSAVDTHIEQIVENEVIVGTQRWDGVPGVDRWKNRLRLEVGRRGEKTELTLREGPHAPGTLEMGRQAWQSMLDSLESFLGG